MPFTVTDQKVAGPLILVALAAGDYGYYRKVVNFPHADNTGQGILFSRLFISKSVYSYESCARKIRLVLRRHYIFRAPE